MAGLAGTEPTSDRAFFLAALALGLAMLALFAVLLLADVVGLARLLPFFALAAVLFLAAAVLVWRWATSEGEVEALQAEADRAVKREKGTR
jgi:predicted branched-subunit amino acid permease